MALIANRKRELGHWNMPSANDHSNQNGGIVNILRKSNFVYRDPVPFSPIDNCAFWKAPLHRFVFQ